MNATNETERRTKTAAGICTVSTAHRMRRQYTLECNSGCFFCVLGFSRSNLFLLFVDRSLFDYLCTIFSAEMEIRLMQNKFTENSFDACRAVVIHSIRRWPRHVAQTQMDHETLLVISQRALVLQRMGEKTI